MRVVKTLSMKHPDFHPSKQALKQFFAKLKESTTGYSSVEEFLDALKKWLDIWSNPSTGGNLTKNDRVLVAGIFLKYDQ
jgi:hypothetical protein